MLQIHFTMFRGILTGYEDDIRDQLLRDILSGKRLGNALAEVGVVKTNFSIRLV